MKLDVGILARASSTISLEFAMKESNIHPPNPPTDLPTGPHPEPIEPGRSSGMLSEASTGARERSRADLILVLGILSLFLCGPLGVIAWVMGGSELKKIRNGRVSGEKIGRVRLGRTLGFIGTLLFMASLALVIYLLPSRIPEPRLFFSSGPLSADQMVFAGEWTGNKGSMIRIHPDGRGDFKTRSASVQGGRVIIGADSLSIGIMGMYKTWHVQRAPYLRNGTWVMNLDGEIFVRKETGLLVLRMEDTD